MGLRKAFRSGLASIFDRTKRAEDGSCRERREVDTSQATRGRDIQFQRQTTHRETTVNSSQGQITNDADPIANAMFSGKVSIYGGGFVQNVGANTERYGFELLRTRVASSAFHNSAERIDPARCHPDTRKEVMQSIYDWIVKQGSRNGWLLWLNGAAGAGKSAIMQSVAERCALGAIAIASFFFIRADSSRNTMTPLVATLVYQLIQAVPETSDDILLTIERNPLIFEQLLESQLQQLLIEPLLRLPTHLRPLFVVFIDGLDECNNRAHQSNLIRKLSSICSGRRNVPVIFLIASRREPQIEAEFCRDEVTNLLTTIPLDDIQASDDIRRYLNAKFKEIKKTHLRKKFLSPNWPSSAIIEQIVEKSSGQFIYAAVVIGYISLPDAHPALQLDIINGIRPRNPSENPFAHLDALYQYIFSQVKRPEAVRNILAFQLIMAKFTTPRSDFSSIIHLEFLFQLADGELEVLFADLTALIQCSSHSFLRNGKMKILHASLPDFLLDESRSGDYYINLKEYRTTLLSLFLERPCLIPDPQSPTCHILEFDFLNDLETGEIYRLSMIRMFLAQAKASDQLQRACMNFNLIIYRPLMLEDHLSLFFNILKVFENLDFDDRRQVYHHVLDMLAVEFSKHLSSRHFSVARTKRKIGKSCPDLLVRINQILQEKQHL